MFTVLYVGVEVQPLREWTGQHDIYLTDTHGNTAKGDSFSGRHECLKIGSGQSSWERKTK